MIIGEKERPAVIHHDIAWPPLSAGIRLAVQESIDDRGVSVTARYLHDGITPLPGHHGRTMQGHQDRPVQRRIVKAPEIIKAQWSGMRFKPAVGRGRW